MGHKDCSKRLRQYDDPITANEAAGEIGVTPAKVAEYCSRFGLDCCKKGGRWIVSRSAARRYWEKLTDGGRRPIPGQLG